MTRRPLIARIDAGVALPFVLDYCRRQAIAVDNVEAAEAVAWWAVFFEGRIRALMGIQIISATELFVWGCIGDGSHTVAERRALVALVRIISTLPYDVSGTMLLDNEIAQRHARKMGWTFERSLPDNNGRAAAVWGRRFDAHYERPLARLKAVVNQ